MSPEEKEEEEAAAALAAMKEEDVGGSGAVAAALATMKEDAGGIGADAVAGQNVQVHGNMQRVKVYCLTDDGQWDDQGTGHITIDYIEGSRGIALAVVDEVDNDTLLLHHITSDNIYKKQDETIISWKDPEKALDLLLSFQEAEGCAYIWQSLDYLQKKLQSGDLGYGLKDLPSLELPSLPLLLKTVLEWGTKDGTRVAELISRNDEFFPKLVDLFRMCEGSRSMDDLHMIFRLVKGIILLNNPDIFDKIFSDDIILDIIGALEYDPEVPSVQSHREFVRNQTLNEAIHIGNVSVASKIRQAYIITHIKDVILMNALDVPTVSSLNSIIEWNKRFVVSILKDDASFIQDLIARITSSNTSSESKSKLILFLRELCFDSKSLEPKGQSDLSRDLIDKGALNIISDVLQSQDKELFSAGSDIIEHFVDLHPDLVRTFIANHEANYLEGNSLLEFLVQGMVIDPAEEMIYQSCLKTLLGSSDTITNHQQDVVLQVFFGKHLQKLIDIIASSCPPKGIARSKPGSVGVRTMVEQHSAKPEKLLKICELLSFCALHHTNRMKIFFLTSAMNKVLTLTNRREKALVVAAVQFMRTIIGRKDDFLVDRVIKLDLLNPVIKAFDENGNRDNLLQSAVLELLEYIRQENLEPLIEYVVESFWDQLVKFERLPSIKAFKLKYHLRSINYEVPEKIVESAETKQSTGVVDMGKKADERGADKEQEGYFNKDSDRVDSSTPTMHSQEQSIPARKPVNADEAQVVGNNPDGGRHSPHKKLKNVASASPCSTKRSEGSGEGDGSRGS